MAIEYTKTDVTSGYNLSKLNQNFTDLETALDDGLSRSGQGPNQMNADIDLNDNDLLNVRTLDVQNVSYQGQTLTPSTLVITNAMLKSQYDPTNKGTDVYDLANSTGQISISQVSDDLISLAKISPTLKATTNITLTVGAGGQYSTINAALAAASLLINRPYAYGGLTVVIRLLTGFVMNEQVIVSGKDLSYITITSVDPIVYVNATNITQQMNGNSDAGFPVFGAVNSAKLPKIGVQFEFSVQQTGSIQGVAVFGGSSVEFLPGSGVRKAARGLSVYNSSDAFCNIPGYRSVDSELPGVYSVDFSSTYGRALDVQHGSRVVLPRGKFNDSAIAGSDVSVYGIWGVYMDLTQAQIKNSKSTGDSNGAVRVRDAAVVCMREADVSGSLSHGLYASHGALVDFRQKAGGGITASLGARNCAYAAIFADGSCKVEATELVATGCCTAADWGSGALTANGCSSIMADLANVSNSGKQGFHARNGSTISAVSGIANTCTLSALYAKSNGQINFETGSATGCLDIALYAEQGGVIEATSCVATGAGIEGVRARRGARVCIRSANVRRGGADAVTDIVCAQGAIIEATASTGGVSKTINTIDGNGIIFK